MTPDDLEQSLAQKCPEWMAWKNAYFMNDRGEALARQDEVKTGKFANGKRMREDDLRMLPGYDAYAREIDHGLGYTSGLPERAEYLDIGCAPGGFSRRLMQMKPEARGHGLTLPVSEGGNPISTSLVGRSRYRLEQLDLSVNRPDCPDDYYDLVICDLSHHGSPHGAEEERWTVPDRLRFRQLHLMLHTLRKGGSCLYRVNFSTKKDVVLMNALCHVFNRSPRGFKPVTKYVIETTGYVLFRDYIGAAFTQHLIKPLYDRYLLRGREDYEAMTQDLLWKRHANLHYLYQDVLPRLMSVNNQVRDGKKSSLCHFGERCARDCWRGHKPDEVIVEVLTAQATYGESKRVVKKRRDLSRVVE